MSLHFIIDAYNLIRHPEFSRINQKIKDRESALLDFLKARKLSHSPSTKITVVFDGHPNQSSRRLDGFGIEIIYSRVQTADQRIKKIIESESNPKQTIVVSDDKEIQLFVHFLGAKALSVAEFVNRKKYVKKTEEDISMQRQLTYTEMHKINQELRKIWLK